MRNNSICMTDKDMERLDYILQAADSRDQGSVKQLRQEMERAWVIPALNMLGDVVTMNSRVRLKDLTSGEDLILQIVYPTNADLEKGKISVLSPVGTALLGYQVGDVISWKVPGGTRTFKIKEMLYQPEAEGDFYQ